MSLNADSRMREFIATHFSFPRMVQLSLDLGVSAIAFWFAYFLRFEGQVPANYQAQFWMLLPLALGLRLVWRFAGGIHQQLWRYVSIREVLDLVIAVSLGSAALVLIVKFGTNTHLPWGVAALDWGINLVGYLALRAYRRLSVERHPLFMADGKVRTRILLVGAGQAGNLFAREIQLRNPEIQIVGFVDDDPHKQHSRVQGIEVLGRTAAIPQLVASLAIQEIILCVPSATRQQTRAILDLCQEAKVKTKTLPGLDDIIAGNLSVRKLREVEIEDLLGRDPIEFDRDATTDYIGGRIVMVTGAGGSIGSELCRQIAALGPSQLLVLGRDEYAVYAIELELREKFPSLALVPLIADVRDMTRMHRVFTEHAPDVVFHAAAHKHVPLMERNPSEAVFNNIFGTKIVAELADQCHAETFVLISTDKAVNPTNVMGASKRAAEMVVQELATRSRTRFMSVRFGNVLGSSGSVIPLFKAQIAAGGPVTVTHPEVIRYFMTIPEASQLVLQAGALGAGGEVFVLDMGDPVKILDLARDMIRLSGYEPETDIPIRFTGLRPGEKLYEELLTAEEGTSSTRHKKIFIAKPEPVNRERLELGLTLLQTAATTGNDQAIRRGFKALVETYRYGRPETDALESRVERADAPIEQEER